MDTPKVVVTSVETVTTRAASQKPYFNVTTFYKPPNPPPVTRFPNPSSLIQSTATMSGAYNYVSPDNVNVIEVVTSQSDSDIVVEGEALRYLNEPNTSVVNMVESLAKDFGLNMTKSYDIINGDTAMEIGIPVPKKNKVVVYFIPDNNEFGITGLKLINAKH